MAFKLSGSVFGYYLPQASAPEARALAEQIHEQVQQSRSFPQRLTVSIGIVNFYELFLEDGSREQLALRLEQTMMHRLAIAGRMGANTICDTSQTSAAAVSSRPDRAPGGSGPRLHGAAGPRPGSRGPGRAGLPGGGERPGRRGGRRRPA